jgi:hypothetical protein
VINSSGANVAKPFAGPATEASARFTVAALTMTVASNESAIVLIIDFLLQFVNIGLHPVRHSGARHMNPDRPPIRGA